MSRYEEDDHYVYQIKFSDGMRYIGCSRNIHQRINTHATNPNKSLRRYLESSGSNITEADISVLDITESKSDGHKIERQYFEKFYNKNCLINGFVPKKQRFQFLVDMPDGQTETISIIEHNVFKPKQELKQAGK